MINITPFHWKDLHFAAAGGGENFSSTKVKETRFLKRSTPLNFEKSAWRGSFQWKGVRFWHLEPQKLFPVLLKFFFFWTLSLEILRDQNFDSLGIPKEKVPQIFSTDQRRFPADSYPVTWYFRMSARSRITKQKIFWAHTTRSSKIQSQNARKKKENFLWIIVKVQRKQFLFWEKAKDKRITDQ